MIPKSPSSPDTGEQHTGHVTTSADLVVDVRYDALPTVEADGRGGGALTEHVDGPRAG